MADGDPPSSPQPSPLEEGVLSPSLNLRSTNLDSSVSKSSILQTTVSNSRSNIPANSVLVTNSVSEKSFPAATVADQFSFGQITQANLEHLDGRNSPTSFLEAAKLSAASSDPASFAAVVKGKGDSSSGATAYLRSNRSPLFVSDFKSKQLTLYQGKPAVTFYNTDIAQALAEMKFVLVGKFTHGRPNMHSIKDFFGKIKLRSAINISHYDKKHILIECNCKSDFIRLWMKLIWSIKGFSMRIFKWDSHFAPSKESPIAPVWIRLEGVPLFLFEGNSLCAIANAIGNPLSIDSSNINRTNLGTARICVELDASKPCIDLIRICIVDKETKEHTDGFWVKVFYDLMPPFCTVCSHIGHSPEICKRSDASQVFDKIPPTKPSTVAPATSRADQGGAATEAETFADDTQNKPGDCSAPVEVTITEAVQSVVEVQQGTDVAETPTAALDVLHPAISMPHQLQVSTESFMPTKKQKSTAGIVSTQPSVPDLPAEISDSPSALHRSNQVDPQSSVVHTNEEAPNLSFANHIRASAPDEPVTKTYQQFTQVVTTDQKFNIRQDAENADPIAVSPKSAGQTQIWMEIKRPGNMLSETASASFKRTTPVMDKTIPTTNSFSVLISESVPELSLAHFDGQLGVQDTVSSSAVAGKANATSSAGNTVLGCPATTTGGVTTRSAAKKLNLKPTPKNENSTEGWVVSTFKPMDRDKTRNDTDKVKEEVMRRAIASAFAEEEEEEDLQKPFIPPKPWTKDGCPAVTFKKSDLRRWVTRQRTKANKEK